VEQLQVPPSCASVVHGLSRIRFRCGPHQEAISTQHLPRSIASVRLDVKSTGCIVEMTYGGSAIAFAEGDETSTICEQGENMASHRGPAVSGLDGCKGAALS
jgi:hypothetical protein